MLLNDPHSLPTLHLRQGGCGAVKEREDVDSQRAAIMCSYNTCAHVMQAKYTKSSAKCAARPEVPGSVGADPGLF